MDTTPKTTSSTVKRKGRGKKIIKAVVILCILAAIAFAAAKYLPQYLKKEEVSTRIVTYNVTSVTKGSVTQTISGSGTLTPVTKKNATAQRGGEVKKVYYKVGDTVKKNVVIAQVGSVKIKAPCAGIIIDLPVAVGDELSFNGTVATIMAKSGFTMNLSVDETEISSIKLGQAVTFTVDAVKGSYTGEVSKISYSGSKSGGSVVFSITAKVDHIEGVYPGMSATAKIIIEDSGEGLLVPVEAVTTSGDGKYVYLAPADAQKGTVYAEGEISLSDLTRVAVETGMSDGTYMIASSDKLSDGSLIVLTRITSTATGSEKESDNRNNMNFPGGSGFNFDFNNFDPSQIPQGGGFNGGGNYPSGGGNGGGSSRPSGGNGGGSRSSGGNGGFSGFGQ